MMKRTLISALALVACFVGIQAQTQVIAHRGFWKTEGSAQNSITALEKAAEAQLYGSEFDVLMTSDGTIVVNHDNTIEGMAIPETVYEEFADEKVNGHATVLEAFAQSILHGTPMVADGREGINSLSISNAAYISTWTNDFADIPVDEQTFEKHLKELCATEVGQKKHSEPESLENLRERWKVRW